MSDRNNIDNMIRVIDSIDNPMVAHTDTPAVVRADEFATA